MNYLEGKDLIKVTLKQLYYYLNEQKRKVEVENSSIYDIETDLPVNFQKWDVQTIVTNNLFIESIEKLKKRIEYMLTMDYQDLQEKRPKQVKQKVKKNGSQLVRVKYPLGKKSFSADDWEEYQDWIKKQKKYQQSQEKAIKKKHKKAKSNKQKPTRKEQYAQDLKHPLWERKRSEIMGRDGYKCRLCGSRKELRVHHLKYSNGKRAWEYPNIDLITLCDECHQKVHSNRLHQLYPKYET